MYVILAWDFDGDIDVIGPYESEDDARYVASIGRDDWQTCRVYVVNA